MEKVTFPVWAILRDGWTLFQRAFVPLFFGHIVIEILYQVAGAFFPLSLLVTGPLWYGLFVMAQDAVRGREVRFEDVFAGFNVFASTFFVGLILTVFYCVCMLIVLIPGAVAIYMAFQSGSVPLMSLSISLTCGGCLLPLCYIVLFFSPAFFIIRDYGYGAWDALKASRAMVSANVNAWISLWVGISILHIIGILTCCVGLLFVMPWMMVILAIAYDMQRGAAASMRDAPGGDELP